MGRKSKHFIMWYELTVTQDIRIGPCQAPGLGVGGGVWIYCSPIMGQKIEKKWWQQVVSKTHQMFVSNVVLSCYCFNHRPCISIRESQPSLHNKKRELSAQDSCQQDFFFFLFILFFPVRKKMGVTVSEEYTMCVATTISWVETRVA